MSDDLDDPAEDPLVGQVIQDRFRVEKKLGQGGMGAIYLAEHLLLKKQVAIKCLHAGIASNPEVVRRFKNEAIAASSIGHPNIIHVMDMGRFGDGTFFMVLEFLDGRDWQEDLDQVGAESVAKVAHVGVQVCAALEAAATKGIVHRDLKPENIFLIDRLGDENFVKILDFGISKILDGSGGATKTGALMGTPYYMAPEQVLGEKDITHLADIYALGVIFFQALSGGVPFEGETLAQIIMKIATQEAPSLGERAPGLPDDLVHLVGEMMAKDPAERPQTFQEVASRLAPFLEESSQLSGTVAHAGTVLRAPSPANAQTHSPRLSSTPARTGRQDNAGGLSVPQRPPFLILGAAAALLLGVGVWLMSDTEDAPETAQEAPQEEATDEAPPEVPSNTVRVQISTVPPDAKLSLDGKSVENPLDQEFDKDSEDHELIVTLDGYQEEKRKMLLTASQSIVIPLSKEVPAPQPGPTPRTSSGSSSRPASKPSPRPSPGSSSSDTPKPLRQLERGIKSLF